MRKEKFKNKVEDYILNKIDKNQKIETISVNSLKLLNSNRIDVVAKYIYALSKKTGSNKKWAKILYKEHMRAMNNFIEENNNKKSFNDFLKSFENIILSIKKNGFDSSKSLLPVGKDFNIINGSHRLGTAIAFNEDVNIIRTKLDSFSFDYKFLKNKGLNNEYLDFMALYYGKLKRNFHVAVVFPIVLNEIDKIEKIISEYGDIFYKKKIFLTRNGIHNLVVQMYRDHEWRKIDESKGSSKTFSHSYNRFVDGKETTVFFIDSTSLEKMKEAKEKIRKMFNMGNYPIHISDDEEEAERMSEQFLNNQSLHFFNNALFKNNNYFHKLFKKFDLWIKENEFNKDDFCVDGSSVLAIYGLRDVKDFDYISADDCSCNIKNINLHNHEITKYFDDIDEIIYDPRNHFYYNGYKFLSLSNLIKLKSKRNQLKDKKDIKLINSIFKEQSVFKKALHKMQYLFFVFVGFVIHLGRKYTPKIIFPYVKFIYSKLKKIIIKK